MHTEALITVAICTYNRHERLKKLLRLLLSNQTLSEDLYQIIVVDNSDERQARQSLSKQLSELSRVSMIETLESSENCVEKLCRACLSSLLSTMMIR